MFTYLPVMYSRSEGQDKAFLPAAVEVSLEFTEQSQKKEQKTRWN